MKLLFKFEIKKDAYFRKEENYEKRCILKDEYESEEWDNLTLKGVERAFPLTAADETFKNKISGLQPSCRALWLRIEFISLTNWFL